MTNPASFPFGSPVQKRAPSAPSARRLFLLGAHPSALHVEWNPPRPFQRVAALAVDNEPVHFWTGRDEAEQIAAWVKRSGWREEWGTVGSAGPLNGSSGLWLDQKVLSPLKATRAETWMTDCIDTYRFSYGQEEVVKEKFEPFAAKHGLAWSGVPEALHHLEEDELVLQTREHHEKRLIAELRVAQPKLVVTLGNAALRVFAKLAAVAEPELLKPNKDYGTERIVSVVGQAVTWLPLIHPGQRSKEWQAAHTRWIRVRTRPPSAPGES